MLNTSRSARVAPEPTDPLAEPRCTTAASLSYIATYVTMPEPNGPSAVAARSRRRSVAGYLTVLKNNFAGTQAAEMGEDPPLTCFCRSRGTCDVTSAVRRPAI